MKRIIQNLIFEKATSPLLTYKFICFFAKRNLYLEHCHIDSKLLSLLKTLRGYIKFKITSTGVLLLFYKNSIVKIPLGKVSEVALYKNFCNYRMLKRSAVSRYVSYNLKKQDCYYEMERLQEGRIEEHDVNGIVFDISKITDFENNCKLENSLLSNLREVEQICQIKVKVPNMGRFERAAMHGDLTERNIMKNRSGDLVLIDLDRFTPNGVKGLDELHFEVDRQSSKLGIDFFKFLRQNFTCHPKKHLFHIYLLYRVSQEHNNGVGLQNWYYQSFVETINLLNTDRD